MEKSSTKDSYLIKRSGITENMDNAHLLEVNGLCPLCGKYLLATKGNRMNKKYQIAHIYPNSPNAKELVELDGVERLGTNCEDFENKIALCKDCHGYYDDHKTKEEYARLLKIKKSLLGFNNAKTVLSNQAIDDEIINVINAISNIDQSTLKKMHLEYKALKISNKIDDTHAILKAKIETYVCIYYNLIKETFKDLDQRGELSFDVVASEFKTSFLKSEQEIENLAEIFESIVIWLKSKIIGASNDACEAIVSFFVQNCEVFHEITQ